MHEGSAGIAQLVEHNLAKVGVAGSSPVSRFVAIIWSSAEVAIGSVSHAPDRISGPGWRNGRREGLKIP